MSYRLFHIRNAATLPFYCRPIPLFFAVWLMMLVAFELHISYTSYPDVSVALLLFAVSLIFYILGHATVRLAYSAIDRSNLGSEIYGIDRNRLRRFQLACLIITVSIVLLNWKVYGLPPLFGFFGADTYLYGEYGSLKQILFPAFMALFITAPLEPSRPRRWFLYVLGPLCGLTYASRGYMLIMLFQFLVMFSMRTSLSRRTIYLIAGLTLCLAIGLSDVIGNGRSSYGSQALLGYMQIKRAYYDLPTAYLWLVSYISSPISNLCWIIRSHPYDHPTPSFLYSLMPGFLHFVGREGGELGSSNIVDGVHTYIAKYYLDLWWFGACGINYVYGLVFGYISSGNRLTRNYLTSSVLLGCLGFIFFADFLTFLIILVELAVLAIGHRYFTIEYSGMEAAQQKQIDDADRPYPAGLR